MLYFALALSSVQRASLMMMTMAVSLCVVDGPNINMIGDGCVDVVDDEDCYTALVLTVSVCQ